MDEQAQRQLVLCEQNRQLAAQAAAVREELAAAEARVQAAREESSSYVEALTLVARCVTWAPSHCACLPGGSCASNSVRVAVYLLTHSLPRVTDLRTHQPVDCPQQRPGGAAHSRRRRRG
jgi:hypothetical protein